VTTIRDLLHQLHQTHDLGLLPILADALLDAGYPETEAAWVRSRWINQTASGKLRWFINAIAGEYRTEAEASRELARLIHGRLTVLCGVCEGRTPQFCSGPCGGVGWLVKPPFQRRKCPECDGIGKTSSNFDDGGFAYITCDHCKGTGTVEETKL